MKITLNKIKVRDLVNGYKDNEEEGVVGYGGKLNIRPPYQREFIYNDKQRVAVINTIQKGFPLNVMYWAVNNSGYEVIDGQQRTISICQYINGDSAVNNLTFQNLLKDKQNQILDYELEIYFCEGNDSEKLDWFETINIAGEKLTKQELRNAVYSGEWVTDAKKYFSKTGCVAYQIASDYLSGSPIRQDYLETAIKWISENKIEEYMSKHQHDSNASALWRYFQDVITWIKSVFPKKYNSNRIKFMKGIDWGFLYNQFKDELFNTEEIEKEIAKLILDDDVTNKKGIYSYVLTRDEKYLSIRSFTNAVKIKTYEKQNGICSKCGKQFDIDEMDADHIVPWSKGGKTTEENCQLLCRSCNRKKSNI